MWKLTDPVVIGCLIAGLIIMAGAKAFEGPIKGGKHGSAARWFAFGMNAVAGLLLAVFMIPLMLWVGKLGGLGVVAASIGTVITVVLGWQAVYYIIAAAVDLMDKTPDEQARKAARWVPTFLPVGGTAVVSLVTHPRADGFGLGVNVLTAAIVSAITMSYSFRIFKECARAKNGKVGWKWFAAGVAFLAGFIHVALVNYLDGILADFIPSAWMNVIRALLGLTGLVLMVCALVDIFKDHEPDQYVRRAGVFGIPLITLFFSLGVALISDHANSTIQFLSAGMR
jgi:hypothetical protein